MPTDRIWKPLIEIDSEELRVLAERFKVSPLIALLMYQSGISSIEEARLFFNPDVRALHDPFAMKDMERAVERIGRARKFKERVRVYGDYDVDGTTSVAVVYHFLSAFFPEIDYYIPDREKEGYGISAAGIADAIENGVKLLIALDCGIRSVELIRKAAEHGLDVIVCDHHIPGSELPPAVAILNPKQADCSYPFKELSGCGIGWKLVQALCEVWKLPEERYMSYVDMVAVSIASDLVSMTGENRVITALGIQKLKESPSRGLGIIIDHFIRGKDGSLELDVTKIVFWIGPRINAAGRLADAKTAVRLLLAEAEEEAAELANDLNAYNLERKELDKVITQDAIRQIESELNFRERYTTVVRGADWHKGVVGIVASRLIESYYRPTIVLTESDGKLVGSARSIPGFNIHDALCECSDHLIQFGGHAFAAGMKLDPERYPDFRKAFEDVAVRSLTRDQLVPVLRYHAEIPLSILNERFVNNLNRFGPFGPDHQQPMFLTRGVMDTGQARTMGGDHEHLRLNLVSKPGEAAIPAVGFGLGHWYDVVKTGAPIHILYHVEMSEFRGDRYVQLMLVDIKAV
ncbi:MAG: single-stranded-DNA-specific exonuclease RecJ [Flavobacteriales bacterium]|nr:single-stranded-DNA-specific exonuclease RecJ [Flavobacteriales bacterium]